MPEQSMVKNLPMVSYASKNSTMKDPLEESDASKEPKKRKSLMFVGR